MKYHIPKISSRYCLFCKNKIKEIDYKDIEPLKRLLSNWNKIRSAYETGNCAKHQKQSTRAIKNARHLALLPFVVK